MLQLLSTVLRDTVNISAASYSIAAAYVPQKDQGQMLYIFLCTDSVQGGWEWGMDNKSDRVAPSWCLSLSHFYCLYSC